MKISRRGSQRDHGTSTTTVSPDRITWNSWQKSIEVTSSWVNDFNTDSQHDWTVTIPLDELAAMMKAAAGAIGGEDSSDVAKSMAPVLTSILRIATAASKQMAAKADDSE